MTSPVSKLISVTSVDYLLNAEKNTSLPEFPWNSIENTTLDNLNKTSKKIKKTVLDFEKLKKDAHNLTSRGDLITLENLIKIDSEWQKFKPYKISKLLAFVNPIGSKKKYCKIKMSDAERIKLKTLAREKKEEIEREEEDRRIK